ncbi:MAG: hypothetical protein IT288_12810 [Bdellovibrionales bacterium]|nr:hypothetical protein [Bdellovibrionales bacterium]
MKRRGFNKLISPRRGAALLLAALLVPVGALARPPELKPPHSTRVKKGEEENPLSATVSYGVSTDYADNRTPRAYTHAVSGGLSYELTPEWNVSGSLSVGANTVGGQIYKDQKQSYDETLSPSLGATVTYKQMFWGMSSWKAFAGGEALLDEASRREGYKGILSAGTGVGLAFSNIGYMMGHMISVSGMLNTFEYSADKTANPNYFYTYAFSNTFKFYKELRLAYTFVIKATRYLDDYVGYSHLNKYGVSYSWGDWSAALTYENGGFTDEGIVDFWYLDQYRRLVRLTASYTF